MLGCGFRCRWDEEMLQSLGDGASDDVMDGRGGWFGCCESTGAMCTSLLLGRLGDWLLRER